MDFQTHQDEAKQSTTELVLLFGAGLLAIIALVSALLTLLFGYSNNEFDPLPAIAVAAPLTIVGVGGASLVKTSQIRGGGGSYVATSMGGRPVDFNTLDPVEKQLSNVVEEIAIASGMAVPAVFVLDHEPGINAFAAGWTADNAAIGVTRGALEHLSRDELQGVIAHEFAHIANGDTKLKTRIIGWVFGIAILTVLGRILLESLWFAPRRRSSKNDNGIAFALMAAGVGLLVIGAVGSLFARLIQAAVSRQRELLADASAVQFTRNPDGLAQALSKIGGMGSENKVHSAHAVEAGHLFFSSPLSSAFSSHPPLKTRISRLLPGWDGAFRTPEPAAASAAQRPRPGQAAGWGGNSGQMLPGHSAIPAIGANKALPIDPTILVAAAAAPGGPSYQPPHLGGPTDSHIGYARQLLARIPDETQNYLHTRAGAVASVLGLLASDEPEQRRRDLEYASGATGFEADYLDAASRVISRLDRPLQLPAIDIALHSIRETPRELQATLREAIVTIESSHPKQDLFRWMLRRVMLRHLEDQHYTDAPKQNLRWPDLEAEAVTVLAAIAWFNSSGPEWAPGAFTAALVAGNLAHREIPGVESLPVELVDASLERLSRLDLEGRRMFVAAATAVVAHDATTTADEAELIRVVADAVRLPVPPLLPA